MWLWNFTRMNGIANWELWEVNNAGAWERTEFEVPPKWQWTCHFSSSNVSSWMARSSSFFDCFSFSLYECFEYQDSFFPLDSIKLFFCVYMRLIFLRFLPYTLRSSCSRTWVWSYRFYLFYHFFHLFNFNTNLGCFFFFNYLLIDWLFVFCLVGCLVFRVFVTQFTNIFFFKSNVLKYSFTNAFVL